MRPRSWCRRLREVASAGVLCICVVSSLGSCHRQQATRSDCVEILERIIDIELREQGFADPILARSKKAQLRQIFVANLQACTGRSLGPNAMACIRSAKTSEEISHVCLH